MNWTITFKSYLRLMRVPNPIGVWLLMWPCWWGLALASPETPPIFFLFLFACGAFLMRSAGCVYNDLIDQDFDRQVKRTMHRPLACGEVTSKEAIFLLALLLSLSSLILLSLPFPSVVTALISLCLVLLYPWMKRLTYWPQVFLGLTFNIGIMMGWLCFKPLSSVTPLLFYGGAILWTLGYDTIYALQDKRDDLLAGIKSTTFVVGSSVKRFLSLVYGFTLVFWSAGGIKAQVSPSYWFFILLIALHFLWQVKTLREDDPQNCSIRFRANSYVGFFLFVAIVISCLMD